MQQPPRDPSRLQLLAWRLPPICPPPPRLTPLPLPLPLPRNCTGRLSKNRTAYEDMLAWKSLPFSQLAPSFQRYLVMADQAEGRRLSCLCRAVARPLAAPTQRPAGLVVRTSARRTPQQHPAAPSPAAQRDQHLPPWVPL
jgi:hypothetical protein